MSLEMDYETIFHVMDSWELLRRIPDHEQIAGTILFTHLFQKCPETKVLFGFPLDMDPGSEKMQQSKPFVRHASNMISMLDRALNMLGPDAELLAEILGGLGKKHARMGVHETHFPYFGESLLEMLHEVLGNSFTPEIEHSWRNVYKALSGGIVDSMNTERSVLDSWAKLKQIDNYDEVAGGLLFQTLFERCPETKTLFGFPVDMDTNSGAILNSRRFKIHSRYFIEMLDKALGMVEARQVEENMKALGEMHNSYGVKEEYFPVMGEALFLALEKTLKEDWNDDLRASWGSLYGKLSSQMVSAMKAGKK
ncbi:Involved in oxygen transport in the brain. Hexacoordinate globin [Seminavis robusta]|uniref:Involved in oxygen transport in the brain. Hexacoordinate globin n=1 Tax=Seminavis robusta TaxID=568900 RepID=A0A9N8EWZ8_9STRA|nr:Involved in oxygen transport in the brain. Hexacoordinate globin [Seminavis robusta]|eukprot:Sro2194_g318510.1 Involved in oxygen transport in the brain. Hexacoordinate globin (309) ;mRNA; f:8115-9548